MAKLSKDNVYTKLMEFSINSNKLKKDSVFTRKFNDEKEKINNQYNGFSQKIKDKYFNESMNPIAKKIYQDGNLNINMQNVRDFFNENDVPSFIKEEITSAFSASKDYIHHPNSLVNSAAAIANINNEIEKNNGIVPTQNNIYKPTQPKQKSNLSKLKLKK